MSPPTSPGRRSPRSPKRLLIDKRLEQRDRHGREIERYRIACRGPQTPVATMSGGNQQKVIVSRWARICRTLLILDEPTRGVDVGAKAEIYRIMRELAEGGMAILMISSELTEVMGMADRVDRHARGTRLPASSRVRDPTEESIMHLATTRAAACLADVERRPAGALRDNAGLIGVVGPARRCLRSARCSPTGSPARQPPERLRAVDRSRFGQHRPDAASSSPAASTCRSDR